MGVLSSKKVTKRDYILFKLKTQRDRLHMYQKKSENYVKNMKEAAKRSLIQGDKQRALSFLREKKNYETLFNRALAHVETLENLISTIEFALIEEDIIYILEQNSYLLKEINKKMSYESSLKLMDETKEAINYQNDISNILSESLEDKDDECLKELKELQLYILPSIPDKKLCHDEEVMEVHRENNKQKESSHMLLA
ncbi:hypothetical protein T552_02727 [Pneumocystis carinii B80]|uniref:Vacuolar protein sorting-associated protein 20 n=1 Tax=Pneumocystis carinii (strain B80) TaxID=1408658 RepID=A0A0W4ZED5_PNEC8|nr:hypothetical protein T552_02727 [Pneumocystis carinii B80]KTW26721.1 hypothetical protein T552_02727 [Pneumocystis carinii B80]